MPHTPHLLEICQELLGYLDTVEVSDSGREFSPTTVQSCRCLVVERVSELLGEMRDICSSTDIDLETPAERPSCAAPEDVGGASPHPAEFAQIGWIAHGMNKTRHDNYKALYGKGEVRVPPKIYKTEQVAARYGTPTPVFIQQNARAMPRPTQSGDQPEN